MPNSHSLTRRDLLRTCLASAGALSLPNILRLRAEEPASTPDTAVIFVMLGGGASHIETYDPKPDAPAEYRGPCDTIRTSVRDAYGRNALGQRLLLARRLVEAGVPFINVRTFDWDDHEQLEPRMRSRLPEYDQGLATLIRDLRDRGMNRDVLVVAMGEFGRTPRVNVNAGRDHWPAVMSVLFAGGAYRMGQVIGASDARGAAVLRAPFHPQQVLGMLYRHLGIDPAMAFPDFSGRPRHILEEREPIRELVSHGER